MPLSEHHLRQLSLQNESATTETLGNDWETQASKSKASTKTTAPKKAPFAAYSIGTKESTFNDDDYEADDGESAYTSKASLTPREMVRLAQSLSPSLPPSPSPSLFTSSNISPHPRAWMLHIPHYLVSQY